MNAKIVTLQTIVDSMEILTKAVLSNKQTLNLEEAAAFTGLATSYLYKLTSTQEIPHYKPRGKMLYFDRSELETWLRQGRVKSITEIDREASAIVAKSKAAA
ncbi:MAG: helix-turn-helix domain-containing protein [Methylococcaceae bacterium]